MSGRWPGIWLHAALDPRPPLMECTNTRAAGSLTLSLPCSPVRQESWPPPRKEATVPAQRLSSGTGRRAGLRTATKNT
eukprot:6478654-Amphidinium_carterae.1